MGIPPIDGHIRVVDDDEGEELDCRSSTAFTTASCSVISSSGEVLVIGAELLVDVEAVDVGLSMVGESMAITLSWVRFPFSGSWSRVLPSRLHRRRSDSVLLV